MLRIAHGLALAAATFLATAGIVRAEVELLMFEQPGCIYCARWNDEVAPEYPLTQEGKIAPLRRLDLHAALPEDISILRPPVFTPTFVLVQDGKELGRIEGYPGEDFFWPLLADMLETMNE